MPDNKHRNSGNGLGYVDDAAARKGERLAILADLEALRVNPDVRPAAHNMAAGWDAAFHHIREMLSR